MCACLSLIRDMVVGECSDEILLQLSSYDHQPFLRCDVKVVVVVVVEKNQRKKIILDGEPRSIERIREIPE